MYNIGYIKEIIEKNNDSIAFLIGNGTNRYFDDRDDLSWNKLLNKLWTMNSSSSSPILSVPSGITNTEFIDALDIELIKKGIGFNKIKKDIATIVEEWESMAGASTIKNGISTVVKRINEFQAPLLTTNFDRFFECAFEMSERKLPLKGKRSTDYYPWNYYYGQKGAKLLSTPNNGFGIWHIHGMASHPRSIRIGLNDYMGLVERSRSFIQKNYLGNGFNPTNTWLDVVFAKSLFVFGLGLETDEVFLRWLLLQRAKFNEIHKTDLKGWYVSCTQFGPILPGKRMFLNSVGFEIIEVDNASIVYEDIWD